MDWLMKILGAQQNGATGGGFGGIGGSSGPAANNGMPMSGVGPGPTATPASAAPGPGVQGLWGGPGNANTNIFGGARGGGQANPTMGIAQSLLQQPQIQAPGFAPMMPMGTMRG